MSIQTYEAFVQSENLTVAHICREIYHENRDKIKIKSEHRAVKNLVTIYNATLALSAQKGFQTMSLRDLCRATGLSMGALYSYFSCKEDLLNMLQVNGFRFISRILLKKVDAYTDPWQRLAAVIRAHLYLSEMMQQLFCFFFMETKNLNKEEQKKSIAAELFTEQLIIDILEQGKRQCIFQIENTVLAASVIKPLLQDWYLKRWKYSSRNITVDEYAQFITDFVECYLRK